MSYKKNASTNRDALFGGAAGGGGGGSKNKPSPYSSSSSATATPPTASSNIASRLSSNKGYTGSKGASAKKDLLSPEAKKAKLKEAEDYKKKAKECMNVGFFKRPDPLAASTYYKRAADCYSALGDIEQERFYRLASGQCNVQIGAWSSAAYDYTRAADLLMMKQNEGILTEQDCRDASSYHKKAADAWMKQSEPSKYAASLVSAAIALNACSRGTLLSKESLAGMEEAVEAHVPDVLNPFARYRQTGHSAFIDLNSGETVERPSPETLRMAKEHLVSKSYAHEPVQQLTYVLVDYGEYVSALYAAGAVSTLLNDGISTLTQSRAFVVETILQLAMGDPIAAEQTFLNRHCNSRSYLSSREAQLAEELTKAIKRRDEEELEEVRSPVGRNKACLANLHESMRVLVSQLRVTGVARKQVGDAAIKFDEDGTAVSSSSNPPPSLQELMNKKTGYEQEAEEGAHLDGGQLAAELDGLELGDDDEKDGEEGLEDDEEDLR